jgi:four helix bundle protein
MLRIYDVAVAMVRELEPVVRELRARDCDLARQLKRAASSVTLNLAEGSGARGGNRKLRYETALGSARETVACLDTAIAWGDIDDTPMIRRQLDEIIGTLVNVMR